MNKLSLFQKKSIWASVLVVCMMLSLFTAVLAEDTPEPTDKTTTAGMEVIPVHGYVGAHTDVVPPSAEIYVEVPVKILFAAFDSDDGAVTSPRFKITNLSSKTDIAVEIEDFEQRYDSDAILNDRLSLKLVTLDNEDLVSELFPSSYASAKLMTANLSKFVEGSGGNVLDFMVGGTWSGGFDEEIKPMFDMTVKFSEAE